jgi:hypothetical protein
MKPFNFPPVGAAFTWQDQTLSFLEALFVLSGLPMLRSVI